MHVLIVEDHPDIVANLVAFLEPLGYTLDIARSGTAALALARADMFDAIVLDLSLPGIDGIEVCRTLRRDDGLATPILMLTARDQEHDKLTGFEAGTDDYLVKPYSLPELDARLRALVRRARGEHVRNILRVGELQADPGRAEVRRAGRLLSLTPTAYRILLVLMRNAPNLVPRAVLERELWGDNPPDSDALRTHIHALRQALDKPFATPMLRTVPGAGYRLAADDEA